MHHCAESGLKMESETPLPDVRNPSDIKSGDEEKPTPPPVVEPPPAPEVDAPEVPPITPPETECPAPNQPRVGDLTQDGSEKVVGHELQGTTCVVLYEDTTAAEKYLPSTNQVSTTAAIAVVATAAAAATPVPPT